MFAANQGSAEFPCKPLWAPISAMSLCHGRLLPSVARALSRQLLTLPTEARRSWQVSSHGRLCNPHGVTSFGCALPSGYCKVMINKAQFQVHRVVAHAFLGPPPSEDAWQVHHKDGNPGNNHIANLVYVTASENQRRSYATGTRRSGGPAQSRPTMYRAVGSEDWTRCASVTAAALELGVSRGAVSSACRRKTSLKGYEISAVDLEDPDLPGEEWRQMLCPVFGQEVPGRTVSSFGRFRTGFRFFTGCVRKDGYAYIGYSSAAGYRSELAHRLVAAAFLGPRPSPQHSHVNHKDGDKQNNAVSNLEHMTPAGNSAHYWKNKPAGRDSKCRSSSKPVQSRAYNSNDRWTWRPSILSAASSLGVHCFLVSNCIHGKRREARGYEFQAAELFQSLPGEEWREVDVPGLIDDKHKLMRAQRPISAPR